MAAPPRGQSWFQLTSYDVGCLLSLLTLFTKCQYKNLASGAASVAPRNEREPSVVFTGQLNGRVIAVLRPQYSAFDGLCGRMTSMARQ